MGKIPNAKLKVFFKFVVICEYIYDVFFIINKKLGFFELFFILV